MKMLNRIIVAFATVVALAACKDDDIDILMYVPVEEIALEADIKMLVGEEMAIEPIFTPAEVTNPKVFWSVKNASPAGCVTIDTKGVVTANALGTATIVAKPTGQTFTAETVVKVCEPLTGIELVDADTKAEFVKGNKYTLNYTTTPATANAYTVEWSLEEVVDECVAIDPATGEIEAKAEGTATVVMTATDDVTEESFIAKRNVEVIVIWVKSIEIPATLDLVVTETKRLTASEVLPAEAVQEVTWSVKEDSDYVSVNATTGEVTALDAGVATIVATATDGSDVKSNECVVTVTADTKYTAITIPTTAETTVSSTVKLEIDSFEPATGVTNPAVVWSVKSGAEYASVDAETGVVTGVAVGSAVVIATATDGSGVVSNDCTVSVGAEVEVNLVVNGGFETTPVFYAAADPNPGAWIKGQNCNYDTDNPVSGAGCIRLSGGNAGGVSQNVPITVKGAVYKFGFSGRAQAAWGANGTQAAKGNIIMVVKSDSGLKLAETAYIKVASNESVEATVTIPEGYSGDAIQISITKDTGICYVDDVFFTKVIE